MSRAIVTAGVLLLSSVSGAEPPQVSAEFKCPERDDAGRVVCQLTLASEAGRIVWADALVVETPSFVKPLRARVVGEVPAPGAAIVRLPVAFVASERGTARVSVRGRVVLCAKPRSSPRSGQERICSIASKRIDGEVVVARTGGG